MSTPPNDPSVFSEPHMRPPPPPPGAAIPYASPNTPDPATFDAQQDIRNEPLYAPTKPADVDHTVWDEPATSGELTVAASAGQITYANWLTQRRSQWSAVQSWLATLGLALVAGPFAIVGALWGSGQSIYSVLMLLVIGPVTEEVMKLAAPTLVVEKWPYVFRNGWQILLCGICSGLAFAAIENLLYLNLYIADPSATITLWRWTVCVVLHSGCSTVASLGLWRAWRISARTNTRPDLAHSYRWLIAAAILHGIYNATALALEATGLF